MAAWRSLLTRLEFPDPPGSRITTEHASTIVHDIQRNLQMMLNSYRGGSHTVPDYGIEDLTDVSRGAKSARRVADEIRNTIARYEPRLTQIEVRYADSETERSPFTLNFDIVGRIVDDEKAVPVVFRSVVEASGEITVKTRS